MTSYGVGIIGCGNICDVYFQNLARLEGVHVVACADLEPMKALEAAKRHGVRALTTEALVSDAEVDIVLNLTVPRAHASVTLAALEAGKHVYSEKPLGMTRAEVDRILESAGSRGLLVGAAPDTFLGGAHQTSRKMIDDGAIGTVVGAVGFMLGGGPESWHPNPVFFYKAGGGPLFDMGPYYVTALVNLLGPVARVSGAARTTFAERVVTNPENAGARIPVETPTHVAGLLEFASGPVGTLITSFDVPAGSSLPYIEVFGTEGTLTIPDPNWFGGSVRLRRVGEDTFSEVPLAFGYTDNWRGLGLADMAQALRERRTPRASGALAGHVVDVLHGILESAESGQHVEMGPAAERPIPMPEGMKEGRLA